ncbi:glycoside hydrolase superfamily [Podospora australis]|uniref:chitinase n=1 Tax=Podospora australis TaxID=1536484 RepID=A0AAN6WMC8_9PEZI|nr:glycoside hydrolase superfamily [Podospora australis]
MAQPFVPRLFNQWEKFKKLKAKRVISFGGWGYSNEPETYNILREAMMAELDGVDFDWEYPGATDIDGTPPGFETDGSNYLALLILMKKQLPAGMIMSIAAPASFWYLKNFPIKLMAQQLDYIVYMTYDLHAMVGYPSTPLILTFFLGDRLNSPAAPGRCTNTSGYISNAEINEIISAGDTNSDSADDPDVFYIESYHDHDSNSDVFIYDETEWVAYMSETTKSTRRDHWKKFNFAGTIDWAVDLQAFTFDDFTDPLTGEFPDLGIDDLDGFPPLPDCNDAGKYDTLEKIRDDGAKIPYSCIPVYMTSVLSNTLSSAMKTYDDLMEDGYDRKFRTYADAIVKGSKRLVRTWMYDHGNDYFTCDVVELV